MVTWGIAQTVLGSLSRYGEKLEALVSLVAIGVLLLILNWFYHRVYWNEHLAELHGRKKKILGIGVGARRSAADRARRCSGSRASTARGSRPCSSCRRSCSRPALGTVLVGVAIGLAATLAVGLLTIRLQRRLPHKKMLMATGLLILWVLVVMVGTTVQTLQVVGWVPVTPVEGLAASVLGRALARDLPDLGGPARPGGGRPSSCSAATSLAEHAAQAQAPRDPREAGAGHALVGSVTIPS